MEGSIVLIVLLFLVMILTHQLVKRFMYENRQGEGEDFKVGPPSTPDLEPDEAEIDEEPTELSPPPRVHQEPTEWDAPCTFIPREPPSDQGPAELLGRVMASREPARDAETTIDSDVSDLAQRDAEAHAAETRPPSQNQEPLDEETDRDAPTVP